MTNNYIPDYQIKVTQITVRNVPIETRDRLRKQGKDHGRSMNNELLNILKEYFLELDNDSAGLDRMVSEVLG